MRTGAGVNARSRGVGLAVLERLPVGTIASLSPAEPAAVIGAAVHGTVVPRSPTPGGGAQKSVRPSSASTATRSELRRRTEGREDLGGKTDTPDERVVITKAG